MGNWKKMMRYVWEVNPPTLLATFDEVLAQECERLEIKPATFLKWYGITTRVVTIQAMLRHERTLWLHVFINLASLTKLTFDEAMARYWANAPAEKIAQFIQTARKIDAINAAQLRMPCRRILVDSTAPRPVPSTLIYWKG